MPNYLITQEFLQESHRLPVMAYCPSQSQTTGVEANERREGGRRAPRCLTAPKRIQPTDRDRRGRIFASSSTLTSFRIPLTDHTVFSGIWDFFLKLELSGKGRRNSVQVCHTSMVLSKDMISLDSFCLVHVALDRCFFPGKLMYLVFTHFPV